MSVQPLLITDAAPSFDEEQAHRRRTYAILMTVHIVGFALSYPLYLWQPLAGVLAVLLSGVLPWVAVLLANDARPWTQPARTNVDADLRLEVTTTTGESTTARATSSAQQVRVEAQRPEILHSVVDRTDTLVALVATRPPATWR